MPETVTLSSNDYSYLKEFIISAASGAFSKTVDTNNPNLAEFLNDFTYKLRLSLDNLLASQTEEIMSIYEISKSFAAINSREELLNETFKRLENRFKIFECTSFKIEGNGYKLEYKYIKEKNNSKDLILGFSHELIHDLEFRKSSIFIKSSDKRLKIRSNSPNNANLFYMLIPEITKSRLTRIITLSRKDKKFTKSDSNFAATVLAILKSNLVKIDHLEHLELRIEELKSKIAVLKQQS